MYFFACIINTFWQTFTDLQAVGLAQKFVDYSSLRLIGDGLFSSFARRLLIERFFSFCAS